jgi:hypothetical protein
VRKVLEDQNMAQGRAKKARKPRKHWKPELAGADELQRLDEARAAAAAVRDLMRSLGKDVSRRLYGETGPEWGTKFRHLELIGEVLAKAFTSGFVEAAVGDQSQQPVPETAESCPACQARGAPADAEQRSVQTTHGVVDWQEPHRTCERCRKAFFPSEQGSGDRPDGPQSGTAADPGGTGSSSAVQ